MTLLALNTSKLDRAPTVQVRRRLNVYTAEFNVVMGAYRYLPFSTGLLRAFVLTDPTIRDNVRFMPFLYEMDTVKNVWNKITEPPDVFAFSVSMWNEQLNLEVAKGIKETYGDSVLVVFGGCHVPHHPVAYMEKHPFIDICVRSEGEETFRDILIRHVEHTGFADLPDVTHRLDGDIVENQDHRAYQKDMDCYPSPYLTGLFDYLLDNQTEQHMFQCILESNRGCPFDCSFCYWAAGGLMTKYRFHSLDYTKDEITFTGKHHIPYIFMADSNFAMHPRDKEIAEHVVRTKHDYGFPDKFRVCVSEETSITTICGDKSIEEVVEGDAVLGWDDVYDELVWNIVGKVVCNGIKNVLRVTSGDYCVEATSDHPIYTKRGWISAGQLQQDDYILCNMQETVAKKTIIKEAKDVFQDLWDKIPLIELSFNKLGERSIGQRDGEEIEAVCWSKVDTIEHVGVKRVYDLVNLTLHPNFFANGILVHNCWGKNTDEKVFQVAGILHQASLEKGITLARQSNDPTTLKNIRRDNIKLATYQTLQKRFMDQNTPTYTELILGLPGETTTSWKAGIDEVLTSGHLKAQLFIYLCQVLPNTELWRPDYRDKHSVKTRMVELTEIHGSQRSTDWITEYEEIVIATQSLPYQDWRDMCKFSWMTMLLHSMKTGFFVLGWLWDRFQILPSELIDCVIHNNQEGIIGQELRIWDNLLDRISVFGESRGQILKDYGNIYWDVEEAALLRLSENWSLFYLDLEKSIRIVLDNNQEKTGGAEYNRGELSCVIDYQKLRMPSVDNENINYWIFTWNTPEYFDKLFGSSPVLHQEYNTQHLVTKCENWSGDKERFARETILWGRKSGTMLVPCEWTNENNK